MPLKRLLIAGLAILWLSAVAQAQELPKNNPAEVWVKGRKVSHSWRDGRIFVATSDLKYLLGTKSDFPQVDLIKALQAKGGYTWRIKDGKFTAQKPIAKAANSATSAFNAEEARRNNAEFLRRQNENRERERAEEAARPAPQGYLVYSVQIEQLEWDFYYIHIAVKNEAKVISDEHRASYHIPASYQNRAGELTQIIPPLAPGQVFPFEPIPYANDQPPAVYVIDMNFFNLVNGRDDPKSRWDKRKQARKRKKNRL